MTRSTQSTLRPVTPVGIAAKMLETLAHEARTHTPDDLASRLRHISELVGGLDAYVEQHTTAHSPALDELSRRTAQEDWAERFGSGASTVALEAEMLSGHVEGQFLKMLVRAMGARRVLEIGMFTGYGALAMAEGLPEDGKLVALELDPFVAEFAERAFKDPAAKADGRKIEIRVGPAMEALSDLTGGEPFDFIFIDADKGGYWDYLDAILETGLLAENGLIGVDNTLLQGEPYAGEATANGEAIRAFNTRLASDARVEQVLVPLRDGVTLVARADAAPTAEAPTAGAPTDGAPA